MCIASHSCIDASDYLGYDMPKKFLEKVLRVLEHNEEEWLYLMEEPGAGMLHIYQKNDRIHFDEYLLSVDSIELNHDDEKMFKDKCEECFFEFDVDIPEAVDGIVTEFSLYENGNGRMMYEKNWAAFPSEEFEKLKEYAFRLQKNLGEYDDLFCTTFL